MTHITTVRRMAQVTELFTLGFTRRQMASALGVEYSVASQLCRRAGVPKVYDRSGWQGHIDASRDRATSMLALYQDGYTLAKIGEMHGLTRERVRQLMTKNFGTRRGDGGQHLVAAVKADRAKQRLDAAAIRKWGCSQAQYLDLRRLKKPTRAFGSQRSNAARRGISWELTLWQWWTIWQESGHWHQRARGSGYVMCRTGDVGPYAVGNVRIDKATLNSSEAQLYHKSDPSLPIGVRRTKSGRYEAHRCVRGVVLRLGTHDTPAQAYAAYLRAGDPERLAA